MPRTALLRIFYFQQGLTFLSIGEFIMVHVTLMELKVLMEAESLICRKSTPSWNMIMYCTYRIVMIF